MLKLKVIIGSTRPARAADQVVSWIVPVARTHGAFELEVADLREWDLPIFGETLAAVGDFRNPVFSAPVAWWGTTLQQARLAGTLPLPAAMRLRAASEGATR